MVRPTPNVTNPIGVASTVDQSAVISAAAHGHDACAQVELQRVDAAMCIRYQGARWSVLQVPGVRVGDLVRVWPAPPAGVLCAAAGNAAQPGTLAEWIDPAHSLPRTCVLTGTHKSWGNPPTAHAPACQCACPGPHAGGTPQTPPGATHMAHTHSHSQGTAHAAPACGANPTGLAAQPEWTDTPPCGTQGSHSAAMLGSWPISSQGVVK